MADVIHVELTEVQQQAVDKFVKEHFCDEFRKNSGGFGSTSKLVYLVGHTSVGGTLGIKCAYCEFEEDITDINTW